MAASTSYTDQIPLTFRHKKFRSHRHYPKNVVDNNRSMDIPVDLKLDEDKTEHAKEIWRSRGLTPWVIQNLKKKKDTIYTMILAFKNFIQSSERLHGHVS